MDCAVVNVTVHVPVPVHGPDQPVNALPVSGIAVRTTVVLDRKDDEQTRPQLMPAGFDMIEPVPLPLFVMVKT